MSAPQAQFGPRAFLTAPWSPLLVRRGDALGLRAVTDEIADRLAPGLSNRTADGRWVTVLAWCIARSHAVYHATGKRCVRTRSEQRERYAWVRPLELMWVARTIQLAEDDWKDRPLPGQRRVRRWLDDAGRRDSRFAMSTDQFRAYRQTGMYGAYRIAFRTWPGLTVHGDGWTPGRATNALAEWLDERLGTARPPWSVQASGTDEAGPLARAPKFGNGDQSDWWLRQWTSFSAGGRRAELNTLPRLRYDASILPEAALVRTAAFGEDASGVRRQAVALEVKKARAVDHLGVCRHLAATFGEDPGLRHLHEFSALADAGMAIMDRLLQGIGEESQASIDSLAREHRAECESLMAAAARWRAVGDVRLRHRAAIDGLAKAIPTKGAAACLRGLLQHHEAGGGGVRWFIVSGDSVERRSVPRDSSARYRFRLWPLCRLAAQCGVVTGMPAALVTDGALVEEERE